VALFKLEAFGHADCRMRAATFDTIHHYHYTIEVSMTLTIPDVDETVEQKLRVLAAIHGRTVQAEAREILTRSVAAEPQPTPNVETPQARMKKAIQSVRGAWKGRMTTDELMELTRGDESDDAYTRR
jgi:plasmid stability protein